MLASSALKHTRRKETNTMTTYEILIVCIAGVTTVLGVLYFSLTYHWDVKELKLTMKKETEMHQERMRQMDGQHIDRTVLFGNDNQPSRKLELIKNKLPYFSKLNGNPYSRKNGWEKNNPIRY